MSEAPTNTGSYSGSSPEGYDILQELGRGGVGVVYQARHHRLNRLVALKMILSGGHAGPGELARFLVEAEAFAHLQHPNIVQIFESGQHAGRPFLTLEYVPGGTLAQKIREHPLPPSEAAALVRQLAQGMAYAHARGVVHRDLKPDNILFAADGTPKITDFGLAKRVDTASQLTATGTVIGTPSYMAPEQATGQTATIGPLADVYALGAILYRLLTGRPPFQAATVLDTLMQVTGTEPVAPTQLQPKIPRDLETICLRCLHKEPERRYAGAAELAEDLRRFQAGEPIVARPVGNFERLVKWIKRRPQVAALLAVVLVLLLSSISISTYFAIAAGLSADEARARARDADHEQQIAEEQTRLAEQKTTELEAALVRGLLRPLGHPGTLVSDEELEALWELATGTNQRLQLLFLEKALQEPATAEQVERRAELTAQALVGLDPAKRQALLPVLAGKLRDPKVDIRIRLACSSLGVALRLSDDEFTRHAVDTLLVSMTATTDSDTLASYAELLRRMPDRRKSPQTALPAARHLLDLMGQAIDNPALLQLAGAFDAVAERLGAEEAAALTITAELRLTASLAANRYNFLLDAIELLAGKLTLHGSATVAQDLVERMRPNTDHLTLASLVVALKTTTAKLPAPEKSKYFRAAGAVVMEQIVVREPGQGAQLSLSLQLVRDYLDEDEIELAAQRLANQAIGLNDLYVHSLVRNLDLFLALLPRHKAANVAAPLALYLATLTAQNPSPHTTIAGLAFEVLADKLDRRGLTVCLRQLHEPLANAGQRDFPTPLVTAYQAAVNALGPQEAARWSIPIAQRMAARLLQTNDADALQRLAAGWAMLAKRLRPDEAGTMATPLVHHLLGRIRQTHDAGRLHTLCFAWSHLCSTLPAPLAAQYTLPVARHLLHRLEKTTDTTEVAYLAASLGLVAPALGWEAAAGGQRLLRHMAKVKDPTILNDLAQTLGTMMAKLGAREHEQLGADAGQLFLDRLASSTDDVELEVLAVSFATVANPASRYRAGPAALHVLARMSRNTKVFELEHYSNTYLLIADRLEAQDAATAAQLLLDGLSRTTAAEDIEHWALALEATVGRLDPAAARAVARQLADQLATTTDVEALANRMIALTALWDKLDAERTAAVLRILPELAAKAGKATVPEIDPVPKLSSALQAVAKTASKQQLVDVLKQPACAGASRQTVLAELGQRCGRTFVDVWEFVAYASVHELALDLASPAKR
jgi:hypothetical protein